MGPRAEGREEGVAWRAKMAKAVGEAASARGCRGWEEKRVCRGWEEGTEREKRVQRLGSGEARAAMAAMPTCMLVTSIEPLAAPHGAALHVSRSFASWKKRRWNAVLTSPRLYSQPECTNGLCAPLLCTSSTSDDADLMLLLAAVKLASVLL